MLAAVLLALPALAAPTFPPLTGRVVDDAHLLSPQSVQKLDGELAQLEAQTGHQLVVATIPDLQGYSIEDYGYQLGRTWQLGRKGINDGAILLVAPNDRKVRIEVGYGLEPVLTERPCASRKWQHAGKFDFIGRTRDGRTVIGDWKTSASGIWPETCLQLAAYRHSEFYVDEDGTEHPMPEVDGAIGVHLRDDGYSVFDMRADEDVYKAFLHVQYVARTAADMKNGWMSDALPAPTDEEKTA